MKPEAPHVGGIRAPNLLLEIRQFVVVVVGGDVVLDFGVDLVVPLEAVDQEIAVEVGVVGIETDVGDADKRNEIDFYARIDLKRLNVLTEVR